MGKWAMYRRRGSSPPGESTAAPLPSVLLNVVADSFLDWTTYAGPLPFYWNVNVDGSDNLQGGADPMTFGPVDAGSVCYVQGLASDLTPTTLQSNTVTV